MSLFFVLPAKGNLKREMPLLFLPCAIKNPAFLCVMACVSYMSTNRGESEKKRGNLTHGNKECIVNQLFTGKIPLAARSVDTRHDTQKCWILNSTWEKQERHF